MKKQLRLTSILTALLIFILLPTGCFTPNDTSDADPTETADISSALDFTSIESVINSCGIDFGIISEKLGKNEYITQAEFQQLLNNTVQAANGNFTPGDGVLTYEDMSFMLIDALGYDELAQRMIMLNYFPGKDVYLTVLKDFGMIYKSGRDIIDIDMQTAVYCEEAAYALAVAHDNLNKKIEFANAFYAVNSYSQLDFIDKFEAVCYGWSKLEAIDGELHLTWDGNTEYSVPSGYRKAFDKADGKIKMLFVSHDGMNASQLLTDAYRSKAVDLMSNAADGIIKGEETLIFDGVVVDFEGLRQKSLQDFNSFLTDLSAQLKAKNKLMYVAVHPKSREWQAHFDGYDYRLIGEIADKVILMAHDYRPVSLSDYEMETGVVLTPLAPIDEIYYALHAITDNETGVAEKSKILLQISLDTAQWKLTDGKVINKRPYMPSYETLKTRIEKGTELKYSTAYESPYTVFKNEDDGTDNVVWYEDYRSIQAKIKLCGQFGITGLSVWRLGNIPDGSREIGFNMMDLF